MLSTTQSEDRERYFGDELIDKYSPSIVKVIITHDNATTVRRSGSIVGSDGLILINAHWLRNMRESIQIRLHDGREFAGRIEHVDASLNLASIRIDCSGLTPLTLGTSANIVESEPVFTIASLQRSPIAIVCGLVLGIMHYKGVQYIEHETSIDTTECIARPLLNVKDEVIGINAMIRTDEQRMLAVPVDNVRAFLNQN